MNMGVTPEEDLPIIFQQQHQKVYIIIKPGVPFSLLTIQDIQESQEF